MADGNDPIFPVHNDSDSQIELHKFNESRT